PEAIAFYYELAGLGSRFLALCIDITIQVVVAITLFIIAAEGTTRATSLANSLHLSAKATFSIVLAVGIFSVFSVFFGYFIAFEKAWSGQTPGKRLLGIRVVRD